MEKLIATLHNNSMRAKKLRPLSTQRALFVETFRRKDPEYRKRGNSVTGERASARRAENGEARVHLARLYAVPRSLPSREQRLPPPPEGGGTSSAVISTHRPLSPSLHSSASPRPRVACAHFSTRPRGFNAAGRGAFPSPLRSR